MEFGHVSCAAHFEDEGSSGFEEGVEGGEEGCLVFGVFGVGVGGGLGGAGRGVAEDPVEGCVAEDFVEFAFIGIGGG